jgi:class 3 adenylate cyclase
MYSEKSNFSPKVSIGLNSGEMVSGNIGSQSLKRLDYTVIGDVVNVAARLQNAAVPGQILILEKCTLEIQDMFTFKDLGEFTLKNKAKPVSVLEVVK